MARISKKYGEPTGVGGNKKPSNDITELTSLNGNKGTYTPNKGTGGGGTFRSDNSGTITRMNQAQYKSSLTKQKIKAEMDTNRASKARSKRISMSDKVTSKPAQLLKSKVDEGPGKLRQ
jgi:hypothetical protein